jgi:hypothetical protein
MLVAASVIIAATAISIGTMASHNLRLFEVFICRGLIDADRMADAVVEYDRTLLFRGALCNGSVGEL